MDHDELIQKKLDTIIELLRQLVALELSRRGASREVIGKRLHVATATVVNMLKGVKDE
jgi:predicted transcriptional regulator